MVKCSKLIKQIVLFGLVGGASFLIDLTITTGLYDIFHFPPYLAGGIGFVGAFFFNFPINRKHVFNHGKNDRFSKKIQIMLFASLSVINLLITGVLLQVIVNSGLLKITTAKACVTCMIAAWNFVLLRFFIFSKRPNQLEFESLIVQ